MKFIASALMGALFSHANSLELATKLTTEQVSGDGPILMQPTAWDPLSYHGMDKLYSWRQPDWGLHSFWVYPQNQSLPPMSLWDTRDAERFCTNAYFQQNQSNGKTRFVCRGHIVQAFEPSNCVDHNYNGIFDQLRIEPRPVQDSFTFAFWVRTTQAGTGQNQWWEGKGLIDGEVPGHVTDFGVSLMEGGLIGFGTDSYVLYQSKTLKSQKPVNDNVWHHIVVTRNSLTADLRIYIDGVLNAEGKGYYGTLSASPRLTVGSLQPNINYFQGQICGYKIFDLEISDLDAKMLYNQKEIVQRPVAVQETAVADEAKRLENERRLADQRRQADEKAAEDAKAAEKAAADAKAAEEKRLADEKAAEKKRLEDEKAAADARAAEEKRAADAAAKAAEEQRRKDTKAAEEKAISEQLDQAATKGWINPSVTSKDGDCDQCDSNDLFEQVLIEIQDAE